MDFKLELVLIPVADVDRAKRFYVDTCGFTPFASAAAWTLSAGDASIEMTSAIAEPAAILSM